jgi:hypothetical protein
MLNLSLHSVRQKCRYDESGYTIQLQKFYATKVVQRSISATKSVYMLPNIAELLSHPKIFISECEPISQK